MPTAWVGIGSNIGDRLGYIRRALKLMARVADTEIDEVSSVYDTLPVGSIGQARLLNAVARLSTTLEPLELLRALLSIEDECDRVRHGVWGPRTLDLDLLLYDDHEVVSEELTLPHPRAQERGFVLIPLAELAPDLVFPGETETVSEWVTALGEMAGRVQRAGDPPEPE